MAQAPPQTQPRPTGTVVWDDDPNPPAGAQRAPASVTTAAPTPGIQWDDASPAGPPSLIPAPAKLPSAGGLPRTGPPNIFADVVLPIGMEAGMGALGAGKATSLFKGARAGVKLLAGMAGAGAGSGAGHVVSQTLGRPGGPPSLEELGRGTAGAAAAGVAGETVAPVLSTAWRFGKSIPPTILGRRLSRAATPDAQAAAEFVGGKVTPGQVSTSPFVQFMDNVASATFGRGRYNQVYQDAEQAFVNKAEAEIANYGPKATRGEAGAALREGFVNEAAQSSQSRAQSIIRRGQEATQAAEQAISEGGQTLERISQRFGPAAPTEVVGRQSQSLIQSAHDAADTAQSQVYNDLWRRTKTSTVDISSLAARAAELADEAGTVGRATGIQGRATRAIGALSESTDEAAEAAQQSLPGMAAAQSSLAQLSPLDPRYGRLFQELESVKAGLGDAGETVTTPQMLHRLRSFYGHMGATITGPERGIFKQLHKAADDILEDQLDPEDLIQYRQASEMHQAMIETFEEGALAKVVEKHPAEAVKALIGVPGAVADLQTAKAVMGDEGWRAVQARVWDDIIKHPNGGMRSEKEILAALRAWSPEEVKAVFAGAEDLISGVEPALTTADRARGVAQKVAARNERAITAADRVVAKTSAMDTYHLVAKTLGKASPEDIPKLEAMVGEEGWRKVQSVQLQRILGREGDATGVVSSSQLSKRLIDSGDRLEATFGKDTANFLQQFARHRRVLEKKNPMGDAGKMYLQLATPGAVASILFRPNDPNVVVPAGAILVAPYVMARIATSPHMQRALIGAMKATSTGEAGTASRLISQLTAHLVRAGLIGPGGSPPVPEGGGAAGGPGPRAGAGTEQPLGRAQGPGPGALAGPPPRP